MPTSVSRPDGATQAESSELASSAASSTASLSSADPIASTPSIVSTAPVFWLRGRLGRWAAGFGLVGVLVMGFLAYLSPEMAINWEAVSALCGF